MFLAKNEARSIKSVKTRCHLISTTSAVGTFNKHNQETSAAWQHPAGAPPGSTADDKLTERKSSSVASASHLQWGGKTNLCDLFFRNISTASSNMPRTSKSTTAPCLVKSKSSPEPSPPGTLTQSGSRRRRRRELRRRGWGDSWWGLKIHVSGNVYFN